MQFAWCNVTLLRYHKTVSVNHWICARNSKHACYCAFFLLMCSKGCHGGWGGEVGGLILTCSKHWHTGVLNVCESASQQLAVVLLSCWTGVIDFVSCEWFSCFTLMRVSPWCDCLQWTGCSVFRINTELGLSISLSPMFIFCTLFWKDITLLSLICGDTGKLGVFHILYLSNWDIDSVCCLHAHCIVLCVCVSVCASVRVYVCVFSVLLLAKSCFSAQVVNFAVGSFLGDCSIPCSVVFLIFMQLAMCSNWRNST